MASGQTKKKITSGITNESRRNGKAWKVRPCGQRHGLTQCKPCALKAETEKNASAQRKVRKAEKKAAEKANKAA